MTARREQRRQQLITLGVELFATKPYDEVAIDDVAAAAGISKGLLYHYFGNKKAYYLACVQQVTTGLVHAMSESNSEDPAQGVRDRLGGFFDFIAHHGAVYRSLMVGASGADLGVHSVFDETRAAVATLILTGIGASAEHPLYRNTVRAWIGAVEAAALDWLSSGSPDRDVLVALHTRALADRLAYVDSLAPGVASDGAMQFVHAIRNG